MTRTKKGAKPQASTKAPVTVATAETKNGATIVLDINDALHAKLMKFPGGPAAALALCLDRAVQASTKAPFQFAPGQLGELLELIPAGQHRDRVIKYLRAVFDTVGVLNHVEALFGPGEHEKVSIVEPGHDDLFESAFYVGDIIFKQNRDGKTRLATLKEAAEIYADVANKDDSWSGPETEKFLLDVVASIPE